MLRVPVDKGIPDGFAEAAPAVAQEASEIVIERMPVNLIEGRMVNDQNKPSMSCRYLMEVRENGKGFQEDSCALFTWAQKFQDESEKVPVSMFAIMDGHSDRQYGKLLSADQDGGALGPIVADRMRHAFEKVCEGFTKDCFESQPDEVKRQLEDQGILVDESLQKEGKGLNCGATFSFAFVTETHVIIGNVGDSSVFYYAGCVDDKRTPWPKSADTFGVEGLQRQKKCKEAFAKGWKGLEDSAKEKMLHESVPFMELERAAKAGMNVRANYVNHLAVTRSFGDFDHKSNAEVGGLENQGVIARPSVSIVKRDTQKREVLGLFTDGVIFEFEETIHGYSRDIPRQARRSYDDGFRVAIENLFSTWDEPSSLMSAASRLHARANSHRGHADNAGIVLVAFQSNPCNKQQATAIDSKRIKTSGMDE